jgi:transposase
MGRPLSSWAFPVDVTLCITIGRGLSELCQRGDRSMGQVSKDFDLTETAVREWVRQAERDAGTRRDGGLTTAERQELSQLRQENRRLREDVEILKRATAFFAKETR